MAALCTWRSKDRTLTTRLSSWSRQHYIGKKTIRVLLRDPAQSAILQVFWTMAPLPLWSPRMAKSSFFGVVLNCNPNNRLALGVPFALQARPGFLRPKKHLRPSDGTTQRRFVPTNMVPGYNREVFLPALVASTTNYAGDGDGNGINRIAPARSNAAQTDRIRRLQAWPKCAR